MAIKLGKNLSIKHHLFKKVWVANDVLEVVVHVPTIKVMFNVLVLVSYNDDMVLELRQHSDRAR